MAKFSLPLDARPAEAATRWALLITLLLASFLFNPNLTAIIPAFKATLERPMFGGIPTPPQSPMVAEPAKATGHEAIADWICSVYRRDNGCTAVLDMVVRVATAAEARNIPKEIALGLVIRESNFDPGAVNARSGDYGLMQVNYRWHRDKVGSRRDLLNPEVNIEVGMAILDEYATRERRDWTRTLRRYNGMGGKNNYPQEVLGLAARIREITKATES